MGSKAIELFRHAAKSPQLGLGDISVPCPYCRVSQVKVLNFARIGQAPYGYRVTGLCDTCKDNAGKPGSYVRFVISDHVDHVAPIVVNKPKVRAEIVPFPSVVGISLSHWSIRHPPCGKPVRLKNVFAPTNPDYPNRMVVQGWCTTCRHPNWRFYAAALGNHEGYYVRMEYDAVNKDRESDLELAHVQVRCPECFGKTRMLEFLPKMISGQGRVEIKVVCMNSACARFKSPMLLAYTNPHSLVQPQILPNLVAAG
jgi:hypothetical protein